MELFIPSNTRVWTCRQQEGHNGSTVPGQRGVYQCIHVHIHGNASSPNGNVIFVG